MTRPGLWRKLTSYPNLLAAAKAASAGKRARPDVAEFLLEVEPRVLSLRRELLADSYEPGSYRRFFVLEPKERLISAAPFRDRVVHHAFTRVVEPIFERRFSPRSFACRKGLGTHAAIAHARKGAASYPHVLKCDVVKYFASADHSSLLRLLGAGIPCERTMGLARTILAGWDGPDEGVCYHPGDDLFSPFERRRGLPLGNQTSQFFANVLLDPLDHFVEQELRPGAYARYVDDFLLFGTDRAQLEEMRREIERFLGGLRLRIHPRKSRVVRTAAGVTFLGWRLFPGRARLVRGNVVAFRKRLGKLQEGYRRRELAWDDVHQRIASWVGHARHGETWRLRESILDTHWFQRGDTAEAPRSRFHGRSAA